MIFNSWTVIDWITRWWRPCPVPPCTTLDDWLASHFEPTQTAVGNRLPYRKGTSMEISISNPRGIITHRLTHGLGIHPSQRNGPCLRGSSTTNPSVSRKMEACVAFVFSKCSVVVLPTHLHNMTVLNGRWCSTSREGCGSCWLSCGSCCLSGGNYKLRRSSGGGSDVLSWNLREVDIINFIIIIILSYALPCQYSKQNSTHNIKFKNYE